MNNQHTTHLKSHLARTHRAIKINPLLLSGGVAVAIFLGGCGDDEIHAYRVPREVPTSNPVTAQAQTASKPSRHVEWTTPSSWHEVETTNSMRIATFHVMESGLEVAVTAFPGDVGGLLANVNRWRGQIGLDPIDEQGIEENIRRIEGTQVIVVDATGADARLIGTIIDVGDGQTWFAKVIGPSDTTEKIKEDLIAFSSSFKVHDHEDHAPSQAVPQTSTQTNPQTQTDEPSQNITTSWQQPAQWTLDPNASTMLTAAYFADSGARITLTSLGGDGGGLINNINRWRGQLGLSPVPTMDDQPVVDLGKDGLLVDLVAADGANRIMAGVVSFGPQTLYFKLTGSKDQVESEIERFKAFITGVALEGRVKP